MIIFDKQELSKNETLKELKKFIGKDIIEQFTKSIQFNDEPHFFVYETKIRSYEKYSDAFKSDNMGSGLSLNDKSAQIRALGESIERFCLSLYRKKKFKKTSFQKLKDNAVDPSEFIKFSQNQLKIDKKKLLEILRNKELCWTSIYSINKQKEMFIPAQLIYVPFNEKEVTIQNPISTGAALGSSYSGAIYRAICEILERDAFMITYLLKKQVKKINITKLKNKKIKTLLDYFKRYFLDTYIFDITNDFNIPTTLFLIIDKTGIGPAVSIGTKTDIDIENAILGSIEEAQKVRNWIRFNMITNSKRFKLLKNNPSEIKSLLDRGLFWAHKENIKKLNFLIKSRLEKKITITKTPKKTLEKLKYLINILKNNNFSIYVKDLTPKNPSIAPFKAVKAIIPEAHPLYLYEDLPYLWSKRLMQNLKEKNRKKINTFPHPFV